jgi:uncharacterized LabA/DUF88 family protein
VDRCALFVDAGYVLGDGAMAVHGTRNRESVSWDYAGVLQVLKNVSREHTGLPLLRCYWYEATVEGRRSDEHNTLADLPGVKLRLGRMRPGRREGVESEIHRDLTTLARNRAISDALVVSADEDLAQVIADVQDLGIRVVLVRIGAPGWTASAALRQECDDIVEIGEAHLRPSVELVVGAEPVSEEERQAAYTSRTPANGHGRPGVIGYPQAQPAGPHAIPPTIYTGAEIAEYQRAAQPASSPPPAAANASGPLGTGQPRPGESGMAGLAPGGPGLTAPPPPSRRPPAPPRPAQPPPPPPSPRPSAPPPGIAAPPGLAPGAAPARAPYSHDIGDYPTLPPQPGVAAPPGAAGQPMPPPGQLPQGQPLPHAPAPAPQRTRVGGQHAGAPSPQASSAPMVPGQHAQHAPPPQQYAPGQPVPPPGQAASGQPVPPRGQPALGQPGSPPGQAVPPPGQAMPAYQAAPPPSAAPPPAGPPAAPAQPGFRGQLPDVAAARQAAATPRPPTVGAPPGPAPGAPPSAVPPAPPVQPGQQLQPGQQPRGYPAGMSGRAPSSPAEQRDRQFPVAPAQPDAGVTAPYVPQPVAVALGDAVQAAHAEGFSFGQAVARDAPALWLEAVLARKPRMPSDLEARLLQDSSLPIDSLLHDEVRHALRRGFWDALERVRR